MLRITLTQVQDKSLGLFERHVFLTGPPLESVKVLLDVIPFLHHLDCTPRLGVTYKLVESALNPLSVSPTKMLNYAIPSTNP